MCCFIDDDNSDAEFESHRYGCANDPNKMCAAYAGCESLVVAEDDAIIYDADGVDVFDSVCGDGDSTDVDNSCTIKNALSVPPDCCCTINNCIFVG